MRGVYGRDRTYVEWVAQSLRMWRSFEKELGSTLFRRTGVLWLVDDDEHHDRYVRASLPLMAEVALGYEELSRETIAQRYPQIAADDVAWGLLEREAGYLHAAAACRAVRDTFVAEGGTYLPAAVPEGGAFDDGFTRLTLSDGSTVAADRFVFAVGPWLPRIFPEVVGHVMQASRQEVFYFGTPAGTRDFDEDRLPVWIDFSDPIMYGFPCTPSRSFKVADDTRGAAVDPTALDRFPTRTRVKAIQQYLGRRFPAMARAPLLESRVCQYTNTPDGHYIVDRHPEAERVWLVGGGSGHGFKLGPALGQFVTGLLVEDRDPHPFFALSRFKPE